MYRSPSNSQGDGRQDDKGFTLIEILIAIVLIGILSAVAVVGISNLVSKGGSSACVASKDASTAASAVYFAANNNTYPISHTFQYTYDHNENRISRPSAVQARLLPLRLSKVRRFASPPAAGIT